MKSSSPNPFPEMAVCTYGRDVTTASLQSTLLARQELNSYLANYVTQNAHGAAVGVSGTPGAGKTHLLAALGEELRMRNDAALCLYARARVDPLEFYKQIVRQIPMHNLSQLTDTSRRRNVGMKNESSEVVFNRLSEHIDPTVKNAFQSLSNQHTGEKAYKWLMGDSVAEFGQLDENRQQSSLGLIATLYRSASVPLCFLIDGLEESLRTEQYELSVQVSRLKHLIEELVSGSAFLMVAGSDEAWKTLPADFVDRLRHRKPIRVGRLELLETKLLLDTYANSETGLDEETIRAIQQHSNGNPRDILTIAHRVFEMHAGDLRAATPESVAQVAVEMDDLLSKPASTTESSESEEPHKIAEPPQSTDSTIETAGSTERVAAHTDNPALVDELGRRPFAEVIAARIEEVAGGPSAFMVNLHGPWGSGKTSVLNFMKSYLQDKNEPKDRWIIIEFNAWRNQRLQPPWWTLIKDIYAQAVSQLSFRERIVLRTGWLLWRVRADWLPSITAILLLVVAVLFTTGVVTITRTDAANPAGSDIAKAIELALKIVAALAATGGAILAISRSLVFGSGSAAKAYLDARSDPLGPIIKLFQSLVKRIKRPLVVLVDDLDRCEGSYVIALLEGIQTLFRAAPVTYVVAADRNWICSSFEQKYGDFGSAIAEPGRPLGYLFLDKVFQVSASLPQLSKRYRQTYWDALLGSQQDKDLQEVDKTLQKAEATADKAVQNDYTYEQLHARIEATSNPVEEQAMRVAAAKQISSSKAIRATEHRLERFADMVEGNPRSMKRLVNAYGLHQAKHFLEGRTVAPEALIRWAIVELRWPLLADPLSTRPQTVSGLTNGSELGIDLPEEIRGLLKDASVKTVMGVAGTADAIKLDEQTVREIVGTIS